MIVEMMRLFISAKVTIIFGLALGLRYLCRTGLGVGAFILTAIKSSAIVVINKNATHYCPFDTFGRFRSP